MTEIVMDRRFTKTLKARYERFEIRAGILNDKPYRMPIRANSEATSGQVRSSINKIVRDADIREGLIQKKSRQSKKRVLSSISKSLKKAGASSAKALKGQVKKHGNKTVNKAVAGLDKFGRKLDKKSRAKDRAARLAASKAKKAERAKAMRMKNAAMGLATVAGGPARRKSMKIKGKVSDVSRQIRKRVDYLSLPFKNESSPEMRKLKKTLFDLIQGKQTSYTYVQTALRNAIRMPILKQKYGPNSRATIKAKRFNRFLFDTGQFYQTIGARVRVRKPAKKGT